LARAKCGMRRRGRGPAATGHSKEFKYQPFRQIGKRAVSVAPVAPPQKLQPEPPVADDGLSAFLNEMTDVRQLGARERARVDGPPPASAARAVVSADAEAFAELSELVAGTGHFDISDSDEHVEGIADGVDPRLLKRLRAGEFAYQAHLDLHGLTATEARVAVDRFLFASHQAGKRCVLVIHGRGLNSKDHVPVLKQRVATWLARGRWSRIILAFASARACDGGAGALYVLLRRDRKAKRPVHVLSGAKW
jgi:DNA-nicking Smr family endonuclease